MSTTVAAQEAVATPRNHKLLEFVEKWALVGILLLMIITFSLLPQTAGTFFSTENLRILLSTQAVILVAAFGTLVPLLTNQFDLSIGNILTLGTIVTASCMATFGLNNVLALAIGILACTLVGVLNGWLVAYVGVNSLIATLGVGTALTGIILGYTGGKSIVSGLPEFISQFGVGSVGPIPYVFLAALVVALGLSYVIKLTPLGRKMIMVGSNPEAAWLVGIRVPRVVLFSFMIGAAVCGIGGALQLAQTGAANPSLGGSLTLPALAAVFLGTTTIQPGRYNIAGTIVAVIFLGVITSGFTLAGLPDWINVVVNGVALVIGVAVSAIVRKARTGSA